MGKLPTVSFATLWTNYPKDPPCVDRDGNPPRGWDNQCAVRIGVALQRSGVSFDSFPAGNRCPTGPATSAMVGSAQKLANWLDRKPRFDGCGSREVVSNKAWEPTLAGRTGIIFFANYWRRSGETRGAGSGDHIDLWNRNTLTPSLTSFLRFTLGISRFPNLNPMTRSADNENWYSDLSGASAIWFWNVP